jgi:hypothetical protein
MITVAERLYRVLAPVEVPSGQRDTALATLAHIRKAHVPDLGRPSLRFVTPAAGDAQAAGLDYVAGPIGAAGWVDGLGHAIYLVCPLLEDASTLKHVVAHEAAHVLQWKRYGLTAWPREPDTLAAIEAEAEDFAAAALADLAAPQGRA